MHLKYSNGSRHDSHLYAALQAVEPNSLTSAVAVESQRGHATGRAACVSVRLPPPCSGGAIP